MRPFDETLRDLAEQDAFRLPGDYDGMLRKVLSELPREEAQSKEVSAMKKKKVVRMPRLLAAVLAAVLLVCGFTLGAFAAPREVEIREVEVPAAQETVTLEDLGLTLILPDSWKGQYTMEKSEFGNYQLYINAICEENQGNGWGKGILFYILEIDEVLTADQIEDSEWNYAANRYLFATADSTYLLYYASDVQWNPNDAEQEALYRRMESEIKDIRIVVDRALQ